MVRLPPSSPACVVQHDQRFLLQQRHFELQYDKFYNARYRKMYDWVREAALLKWGQDITLIKLSQLMEQESGKRLCVIGVLLKVMQQHPSVLREVSEDLELVCLPDWLAGSACADSLSLSLSLFPDSRATEGALHQ